MDSIGDYITLAIVILGLSFVFFVLWDFDHPMDYNRNINTSGKYIPNDELPLEAVCGTPYNEKYFTKLTGRDYVKECREYNKKQYDKKMKQSEDMIKSLY